MLKVSNLPISTTESDLRELFSHYGEIHIDRIETTDDESIAYVKLGNDENEKDAIEKLNGSLWRANNIHVDRSGILPDGIRKLDMNSLSNKVQESHGDKKKRYDPK